LYYYSDSYEKVTVKIQSKIDRSYFCSGK
jgi:hypothetical protein